MFRARLDRPATEQVDGLVVEVERLHGGAERFRSGTGDGVSLLPDATRQGTRERVPKKTPNLRSIPRQQRGAETVQVVEHVRPECGR